MKDYGIKVKEMAANGFCVCCGVKLQSEESIERACCPKCWLDMPQNEHGDD